jgi:hypothetical protein
MEQRRKMLNALTAFHGTAMGSVSDLSSKVIAGQKNRPNVNSSNTPFLRLDPEGDGWLFGSENIEVEKSSQWAINPFSFRVGHVNWADPKMNNGKREKLGEVMASCDNLPDCPETDFSEKGGSWSEQFGFDLICVSGEDEGTEVAYNTNSYGGSKAYDAIYDAVADQLTSSNRDYCFPIVSLEVSSYRNKNYNRTIYEPVFEVIDWADRDKNLLSAGTADQQEAPEAVTSETGAAPEADATQAPKRRRSRQINA